MKLLNRKKRTTEDKFKDMNYIIIKTDDKL